MDETAEARGTEVGRAPDPKKKSRPAALKRKAVPASPLVYAEPVPDLIDAHQLARDGVAWAQSLVLAQVLHEACEMLRRPGDPTRRHVDLVARMWKAYLGKVGTQPKKASARMRRLAFLRSLETKSHGRVEPTSPLHDVLVAWNEPYEARGYGSKRRVWTVIADYWRDRHGEYWTPRIWAMTWTKREGK